MVECLIQFYLHSWIYDKAAARTFLLLSRTVFSSVYEGHLSETVPVDTAMIKGGMMVIEKWGSTMHFHAGVRELLFVKGLTTKSKMRK